MFLKGKAAKWCLKKGQYFYLFSKMFHNFKNDTQKSMNLVSELNQVINSFYLQDLA